MSLTGKDLIIKTMQHQDVPNIPWVPFAGVHAGKLLGYDAQTVLTNADKLIACLLEVNRLYDPDGQPVLFDLQVEAEILGCDLIWSKDSPPSVASHPLANQHKRIPTTLPTVNDGRLPMILETMHKMKAAVGKKTALYGLITGPFTLASHLRGTDIFLDTVDAPEFLIALIDYATQVSRRMIDLYLDAGMDIIALVDPVTSQISPRTFSTFLLKAYNELFSYIREKKAYSAFFVCGDATKNIELMCQAGPDSVAVDENINMVTVKPITDRYNVILQGNIPLTSCMLLGNQQDNMKYVVDLLAHLQSHKNLILSPGCDMPYDTPVENVIATVEAVRDPVKASQILAGYQGEHIDLDSVLVPDYSSLDKPLIEVFTLDSATCAACGYMLSAAQRAVEELDGLVDMIEYKATKSENIARMMKMGIKNLPSILINGELFFSSLIPSQREFIAAIEPYINCINK